MSRTPPPRPDPPRRAVETVGAWVAWFGPARLVVSALSVLVVVVGVVWLVRAPSPSTESGLPFAGATSATGAIGASGVASTLPPPATTVTTAPSAPAVVIVHVAGAVRSPGVYELPAASRVTTAISFAGGPTASAQLDGLNLAARVGDGQRIYVPEVGEVDPATVPTGVPAATAVGAEAPAGPVDLNRASVDELVVLPGIGPATAAAIVDDRERHGPFASVDDVQRVPGIGPAKLAAIVDLVTV